MFQKKFVLTFAALLRYQNQLNFKYSTTSEFSTCKNNVLKRHVEPKLKVNQQKIALPSNKSISNQNLKMSEAETNKEGCVFCQIGRNEVPETELLYDDIDYAVFRFDLELIYLRMYEIGDIHF